MGLLFLLLCLLSPFIPILHIAFLLQSVCCLPFFYAISPSSYLSSLPSSYNLHLQRSSACSCCSWYLHLLLSFLSCSSSNPFVSSLLLCLPLLSFFLQPPSSTLFYLFLMSSLLPILHVPLLQTFAVLSSTVQSIHLLDLVSSCNLSISNTLPISKLPSLAIPMK